MSDILMPQSPLEGRVKLGAQPGLGIQELPGMTQFQVLAHKGKSTALGRKLAALEGVEENGLFIYATAPGEYWVFAEENDAHDVKALLSKKFSETVSIFDQSHGRLVLRIEGPRAADIVAKGSPLDLDAMPGSGAAHTVIEHMPVLVCQRTKPACYDISVPRSYAISFVAWLMETVRDM